jgi:hypothetical protein
MAAIAPGNSHVSTPCTAGSYSRQFKYIANRTKPIYSIVLLTGTALEPKDSKLHPGKCACTQHTVKADGCKEHQLPDGVSDIAVTCQA